MGEREGSEFPVGLEFGLGKEGLRKIQGSWKEFIIGDSLQVSGADCRTHHVLGMVHQSGSTKI